MVRKIKVVLDGATAADYYELERIFNSGSIAAEIVTQKADGTEMGFDFRELIVLLPLAASFMIQFRKILVAYLKYKKTSNKKTVITLENGAKKLKIESENDMIPSIDEFMTFFNEET